jgi:hypothetical protein
MAEFQNDEEKISHYKKVILPLETLVQVVNVSSPDTKMAITVNLKGFDYIWLSSSPRGVL